MIQKYQKWKIMFYYTDYNKLTNNITDAKMRKKWKKKLVNESGLNPKIKTLAAKKEIKTPATKTKLKAEQDKIAKLETNDLSYYLGKNIFGDDGSQNMFVYQPNLSTLQLKKDKDINYVLTWK